MPQRKPVDSAGLSFSTRNELLKYIQSLVNVKYKIGDRLSFEDRDFFIDLIRQLHHRPADKLVPGIAALEVIANERNPRQRALAIIRPDGTYDDFSYTKCISPKHSLRDFYAAGRSAIEDDITAFRQQYFSRHADSSGRAPCVIDGKLISTLEAHVDHVPPATFLQLLQQWKETERVNPNSVAIGGYGPGETRKYFLDDAVRDSFRDFHVKNAVLRVICEPCNLSAVKRSSSQEKKY